MHFTDRSRGVVLLSGPRCPGGDLRVSSNGGALWTTVPCVAVGPKVPQVLTVVTSPSGALRAIGRLDGRLVLLRSADGRTWTSTPV
jgi:hypothetical protein